MLDQALDRILRAEDAALNNLALDAAKECKDGDDFKARCTIVRCPSRGISYLELDGEVFKGLVVWNRFEGLTCRVDIVPLDEAWPEHERTEADAPGLRPRKSP